MASDMDWTEEAVARLRAFWQAGHSTAGIGRRMGISKNAVVGKAHRLGLPSRASPIRAKGTGSTPRPAADSLPPQRPPRPLAALQAPPTRADPLLPQPTLAKPERPAPSRPAKRQPCCWPIGHPGRPGFRFCDADAMPRKPYCAEHAGLAYVQPEAARDPSGTVQAAASTRRSGAG